VGVAAKSSGREDKGRMVQVALVLETTKLRIHADGKCREEPRKGIGESQDVEVKRRATRVGQKVGRRASRRDECGGKELRLQASEEDKRTRMLTIGIEECEGRASCSSSEVRQWTAFMMKAVTGL
jgi:hypothetical protein